MLSQLMILNPDGSQNPARRYASGNWVLGWNDPESKAYLYKVYKRSANAHKAMKYLYAHDIESEMFNEEHLGGNIQRYGEYGWKEFKGGIFGAVSKRNPSRPFEGNPDASYHQRAHARNRRAVKLYTHQGDKSNRRFYEGAAWSEGNSLAALELEKNPGTAADYQKGVKLELTLRRMPIYSTSGVGSQRETIKRVTVGDGVSWSDDVMIVTDSKKGRRGYRQSYQLNFRLRLLYGDKSRYEILTLKRITGQGRKPRAKNPGTLSVPEKHQKKIAIATLKMSDAGANIMGGMTKNEARSFLRRIGYSATKVDRLENPGTAAGYKVKHELFSTGHHIPKKMLWVFYKKHPEGGFWVPVSWFETKASAKKQEMIMKQVLGVKNIRWEKASSTENPGTAAGYKKFHGNPPDKGLEIKVPEGFPTKLWLLGDHHRTVLESGSVLSGGLVCAGTGNTIYLVGVKKNAAPGKSGRVTQIEYTPRKNSGKHGPTYYHPYKTPPKITKVKAGYYIIRGARQKLTSRGIIG